MIANLTMHKSKKHESIKQINQIATTSKPQLCSRSSGKTRVGSRWGNDMDMRHNSMQPF